MLIFESDRRSSHKTPLPWEPTSYDYFVVVSRNFAPQSHHDLHLANIVSVTFIFQNNGKLDASVTQYHAFDNELWPVSQVLGSSQAVSQLSRGSYATKTQVQPAIARHLSTPTKMSTANSSKWLWRCYWIVFVLLSISLAKMSFDTRQQGKQNWHPFHQVHHHADWKMDKAMMPFSNTAIDRSNSSALKYPAKWYHL